MGKVKTADFFDYGYANRTGRLSLQQHGEVEHGYWTGAFYHPLGIVDVYRQEDHTRLTFCHGERIFHRSWNAYWGNRTINQLARQFVADVLTGDLPPPPEAE